MTQDEWSSASAGGRRWAFFGSMLGADADAQVVRVIRWSRSGVRVRFSDGHQETVHPDHLHLTAAA